MLFINKETFKSLSQEDQDIYTQRSLTFKAKANGLSIVDAKVLSARPLSNGNYLLAISNKVIMTIIVPKILLDNAYSNGVTSSLSRMLPNLSSCLISFTAEVALSGELWKAKDGSVDVRTSNTLIVVKPSLKADDTLAFRLEMVAETVANKAAETMRAPIVLQHADDLAPIGE